jgi:thiamine phosphate synthase YjbQ (UPF0047 family)
MMMNGDFTDFTEFLEKIAPQNNKYHHNSPGDENGDAHIKRQIFGRDVTGNHEKCI